MAVLNGAIVIAFARPIAQSWIQPERLPVEVIVQAVLMMGVVQFLQWPLSMYSGGLLGLQRQVSLNTINATIATVRAIGTIVVLWLVAPTIVVFFAWQTVVSAAHTAAVAVTLRRSIGGLRGAAFNLSVLRSCWRFAAGIIAIGVVSTALMQVDKLVVSKLLPLSELGYYTLAGAAALSLYRIISPLFSTLFPRFSQLVAADDGPALVALYHRSCEALSVIVLPAAIFLAFFSREFLRLWTGDPLMAGETHAIMTVLVIGTAMSGLMHLPYAIQLAYGWTRLAFTYNLVSVLILFPGTYLLTRAWGAVGASISWLVYNTVGLILIPALMHRRVLKGERARFYREDVGRPLVAAVIAAASVRLLMADTDRFPPAQLVPLLVLAAAFVQVATITAARGTRAWMWSVIQSVRA